MAFFGAGILAGMGASFTVSVLDYALGRPMNLWGKSIDAAQEPGLRAAAGNANADQPNILPPVDAIFEAWRRGLISDSTCSWATRRQGVISPADPTFPSRLRVDFRRPAQNIWKQCLKMRESRPDPISVAQLAAQGRLTTAERRSLQYGIDADWELLKMAIRANTAVPGASDLYQLQRLGRISPSDLTNGLLALGWYDQQMRDWQRLVTPLPGLYDLIRYRHLDVLSPGQYARYSAALGHTDPETRRLVEFGFNQQPSGPEILQLAVKDAWNEQVVQRWGYDAEFPEPFLFFMRAAGYDWGREFVGRDGVRYPAIHWPQLMWRAHWQVISPGQAYQAYRRLRPERIGRYLAQFPGLTAFTADDLATVLRVHDYPPAARDWLAALQSQPLRMYTIRSAYSLGARDREWAMDQLRDGGYLDEDAGAILDTIDAQDVRRETAWADRLRLSSLRDTAREVVAGYGDGFVPRDEAIQRLLAVGVDGPTASRLLDLEDSRRLRADLKQALSVLRREYLGGALSDADTLATMLSYRVAPAAAARYLARWQGLRSLERRTATTGQILAWVRDGLMTAPAAQVRLANLGWTGGDALLAVADALHHLEAHQAQVAVATTKATAASAKQLQAHVKAGQAAVSKAQHALRSLTPIATLKRWLADEIVTDAFVISRLTAEGYDAPDITRYLDQWRKDNAAAAAKKAGGKAAAGHPPAVQT
jgi:hypothetical protein